MSKVVQAAGRVIRTESDVGAVVLVGRRFVQNSFVEMFPPDWNPMRTNEISASLKQFWLQV